LSFSFLQTWQPEVHLAANTLEIAHEGEIAILTIHREERRNALDEPTWKAVHRAAESLAATTLRAVIITGAGDHFSAGMDLSPGNPLIMRLFPALQERDEGAIRALIHELKEITAAIARIPCPVIAAIEGACVGGGMEIALACDVRIAAEGAFLSLPEPRLGMAPDLGATVRAVRLLGRARASELILTGRRVGAEEARAWGLVNRVCPKGRALLEARAFARETFESGPATSREVLHVLRQTDQLDDATAFEMETEAGVRALLSGECMEGVQAFIDKRAPRWSTKS
jgi:enoyl-CoA hydratase